MIGALLWWLILSPWVVLIFWVLWSTSGPDKPVTDQRQLGDALDSRPHNQRPWE